MNNSLGLYLDNYRRLETPEADAYLGDLTVRYPWFTLGREMHLRCLGATDPARYLQLARSLDARLYAHPYPQVLLPEALHAGQLPAPDTLEMIDSFLSKEITRIAPPETLPQGESEDISVESVTAHDHLATETLAQIYLQQGHPEKAIEIYSRLSLTFPEKSGYFADLIAGIRQSNPTL